MVAVVLLATIMLVDGDVLFSDRHQVHEGDIALNSLLIRDAADLELGFGPYSRHGFHHPGPITFYLLAAGSRLLPLTPTSLGNQHLVQLLLNILLFAVAMRLHARVAGSTRAGLLYGLVLLMFIYAKIVSPGHMHPLWEFWGPLVVMMPTAVLLHAVVLVARGDRKLLPTATACAVLMVQNHASLAIVAAPLLATAVVREIAVTKRGGARRSYRYHGWAFAVLLISSLPPLIEELGSGTGNLTLLWNYIRDHSAGDNRLDVVVKVVWGMIMPPLQIWLPVGMRSYLDTGLSLWIAAATVGGLIGTRLRRFDASEKMLAGAAVTALLLSVIWGLRMEDDPSGLRYLFHFVSVILAILVTFALRAAVARIPRPRLLSQGLDLAVAVVCVIFLVARFTSSLNRQPAAAAEVTAALAAMPGERLHLYLGFGTDDHLMWPLMAGSVLRLEQHGVDAVVPRDWSNLFGVQRTTTDTAAARMLVFTKGPAPATWPELWRKGRRMVLAPPNEMSFRQVAVVLADLKPEE